MDNPSPLQWYCQVLLPSGGRGRRAVALENNGPSELPLEISWCSVPLHSIFVPFSTFDPLSAHPTRSLKSRIQVASVLGLEFTVLVHPANNCFLRASLAKTSRPLRGPFTPQPPQVTPTPCPGSNGQGLTNRGLKAGMKPQVGKRK